MSGMPDISFCTWLKGRLHTFSRTIHENLARTSDFDVEFVILGLASPDGLGAWVADNLSEPLATGRVRYWEDNREQPVHFSKFKNAVHRDGKGRILVNLDGDNVVGPRFCEWLLSTFVENVVAHPWTGEWKDGTCGRIAISRGAFRALGGYDESLSQVGFQDQDLILRAQAFGIPLVECRDPEVVGYAIPTSQEEKMRFINSSFSYDVHNNRNRKRSSENVRARRLVANSERRCLIERKSRRRG